MTTTLDLAAEEKEHWRAVLADPVLTAKLILGFTPWSKQVEILTSIDEHKRTAVRSCNAAGKTAIAAVAAVIFLIRHPNSTVITTAPTGRQVEELLWREIRKLHARADNGDTPAKWPLGGRCLTTKWEIAPDWFAIGFAADPTKTERFQGFHSDNILFIVDEASGVAEPIYEAIQGSLVNKNAKILMIGNPTNASGEFGRAFSRNRGLYNTVHISAFDTPAFTGEDVPDAVLRGLTNQEGVDDIRHYGGDERSPIYQVRVLGEFPRYSDNQVMNLADVEAAMNRAGEMGEPRILSCDVARFGSDKTVIALRRGMMVEILDSYNGRDTMETAGRVLRLGHEHRVLKAVIDDTGVGGGVTDRLRELGPAFNIDAYNAGAKPSEPTEYPNRRSEAWFTFASVIHDVSLPEDDELLGDLCAPVYKIDSQGRRVVESKDDTKKKLGRSPDRADAVLMLFNTHASTQARTVSDTSTIPPQQRDSARGGTIGNIGSTGRNMATTGW